MKAKNKSTTASLQVPGDSLTTTQQRNAPKVHALSQSLRGIQCPQCENRFDLEDAYYNINLEEKYCSEYCMNEAELDYEHRIQEELGEYRDHTQL